MEFKMTIMDSNQENFFVFEDSDHNNFLEKLNTLRKSRHFCDVILQVGTAQDVREIYAHRVILASSSRYFLDIFTNDSNSASPGIPQIQLYKLLSNKYDVDAFNYILDFIYTSRLVIPKKSVRNVYALASRLKMTSLAQKCGEFLASTLTAETCLNVRSTNGVLNDPILLNSVDNYIKENIIDVIKSKFVEKLDKIKIEVLQNSDEEIDSVNPKHLFALIIDWCRNAFDENRLTSDKMLLKTYMLYLNSFDRMLHDCEDIENGDHNYSEVIHEYKSLSRKLSTTKRSTENVNLNVNHMNKIKDQESNESSLSGSQTNLNSNSSSLNELAKDNNNNKSKKIKTNKPKQYLFTRSDSDSSLSSLADDDENDWKVLAVDINGNKNNLNGLLMIAGKLYLANVKLKIHSPHTTRTNSLEKSEICSTIALMNDVRCALGSACLNGQLVCVGGYNRTECLKSVELYDALTNKWTYLEPMKVPRARFNVTVLDDKLYAIAGSNGSKELSNGEVYDLKEKCWKFISKCPIERSNAGVCTLNGLIYLVGGWNQMSTSSNVGHDGLKRCDVYDPKIDEWRQIADLKVGRYQVAVTVLNGFIYAAGGCNYTCLNSVERYDPEKNEWILIDPMHTCRRGCGLVSFDKKLLSVGGSDGVFSLQSCEIYDPEKNIWTKGPSLNVCRANVACAVVDNCCWAIGGYNGKQFLNNCEYLDVKNNEWTTFLKKNLNGNSKLSKENTLTNLDDLKVDKIKLNDNLREDDQFKQQELNDGDRKELKSSEFNKSKEPLIEVEGEKMDETIG